ncbi:putative RNA recognition motif domain, nucleotide-binding alpha-beta plait domain superfamily [Helianthus debilis subsp. tardiflorus]
MELRKRFGFVQFVDPADAAEAKYQMDGQVFQGRKLTVIFAEENRKKPADMRSRERRGGRGSRYSDRRRLPPRRYSPPPRYARSRSCSREYSPPPKRRQQSRSFSPRGKRYSRERLYSRSPVRARSPPYNGGLGVLVEVPSETGLHPIIIVQGAQAKALKERTVPIGPKPNSKSKSKQEQEQKP